LQKLASPIIRIGLWHPFVVQRSPPQNYFLPTIWDIATLVLV
jgi:hypothetical protein